MRVMIATPETALFEGWRAALENEGLDVVVGTPDRREAGRLLRSLPPAIVIYHMHPAAPKPAEFRRYLGQLFLGAPIKVIGVAPGPLLAAFGDDDVDDVVPITAPADELLFRMRRVADWRRRPSDDIEMGELVVLPAERKALVGGQVVELRFREFELLWFLAAHPNRVFRREELIRHVWGSDFEGSPRTVDVHITRLRERLGVFGQARLRSVRRVGYCLMAQSRGAAPDGDPGLSAATEHRGWRARE